MNKYKLLNEFKRKSMFTGKISKYVTIEIPNESVKINKVLLKVNHIYEALDPKVYGPIKNYWEPINNSNINIKRNFNKYRKKQGLMMPRKIRYLRKNIYNLNQRELAVVLGLGYSTISKIEDNKIIQSISQDSALRILLNPNEMVNLINDRLPIVKESPLANKANIKRKANANVKDIVLKCINIMAKNIRCQILGKNSSDLSNPSNINQKIENSMNAKIIYTNNYKADGAIKYDRTDNAPEIVLAKGESHLRQRFTIAHELGHLIIHENWLPNRKDKSSSIRAFSVMYRGYPGTSSNYKEEQADEFAADFLMPANGIKNLYKNAINKNPDYLKFNISKRYKVSNDAAYHRIKNLISRNIL